MKRILTALALFAVLGSPAWAVYHEETPINSAEIVENGKVLNKHVWNSDFGNWSFTDLMIVFQNKYYICRFNEMALHCTEKEAVKPTMLGDK